MLRALMLVVLAGGACRADEASSAVPVVDYSSYNGANVTLDSAEEGDEDNSSESSANETSENETSEIEGGLNETNFSESEEEAEDVAASDMDLPARDSSSTSPPETTLEAPLLPQTPAAPAAPLQQARSARLRGGRAWKAAGSWGGWHGNHGNHGHGPYGWGHGVAGETCCMCSQHSHGMTLLYAAGDYNHWFGSRSAHQQCDQVCEIQCHFKGGHKFGCYEEQDLIRMSQHYQGEAGFRILHNDHFGGIC